jgi:hypothetical protein
MDRSTGTESSAKIGEASFGSVEIGSQPTSTTRANPNGKRDRTTMSEVLCIAMLVTHRSMRQFRRATSFSNPS